MGEGSDVTMSCGVGWGHGSDPCCYEAAVAPIPPLAWEFPYAAGGAKKKKKKKKKKKRIIWTSTSSGCLSIKCHNVYKVCGIE